jgi:hypothetical protein
MLARVHFTNIRGYDFHPVSAVKRADDSCYDSNAHSALHDMLPFYSIYSDSGHNTLPILMNVMIGSAGSQWYYVVSTAAQTMMWVSPAEAQEMSYNAKVVRRQIHTRRAWSCAER